MSRSQPSLQVTGGAVTPSADHRSAPMLAHSPVFAASQGRGGHFH